MCGDVDFKLYFDVIIRTMKFYCRSMPMIYVLSILLYLNCPFSQLSRTKDNLDFTNITSESLN